MFLPVQRGGCTSFRSYRDSLRPGRRASSSDDPDIPNRRSARNVRSASRSSACSAAERNRGGSRSGYEASASPDFRSGAVGNTSTGVGGDFGRYTRQRVFETTRRGGVQLLGRATQCFAPQQSGRHSVERAIRPGLLLAHLSSPSRPCRRLTGRRQWLAPQVARRSSPRW